MVFSAQVNRDPVGSHPRKENGNMIRYAYIAILAVSMVSGCKDLGSSSSPDDSTDAKEIAGTFVVDYLAVECTVKVNPGNGSLCAYFPWTLRYHFAGRPGSVNGVNFVPVGFLATHLFLGPMYPDSIGRAYNFSSGFWTNSSLPGLDSVAVQFNFSGVYWDRLDGEPRTFGTFGWTAERKIPVRHQ
jgi:hypothetical protein